MDVKPGWLQFVIAAHFGEKVTFKQSIVGVKAGAMSTSGVKGISRALTGRLTALAQEESTQWNLREQEGDSSKSR